MPRKEYRTKQTIINELRHQLIIGEQDYEKEKALLKETIQDLKKEIDLRDKQIISKERAIIHHAKIIDDILHPSITITAWRECWIADHAPEILSSTELWVISDDGNTYKDLFNEAIKVKKSLMDFYRSQESEIRITISLNDWPDENIFD